MSISPRCQFGRFMKRTLMISAAMPLVACANIPMPEVVDNALPGVFAPDPISDPITKALEAEEEVQTILAELNDQNTSKVVEAEDVKQPDVFQATDVAMWDGRPALGDIWVSVPDALQPERVLIRNEETGAEIKGAMFVRDSSSGKAPIRLSPGAAKALGVAPRELARISVTAIRKQPQINEELPVVTRNSSAFSAQRLGAQQLDDLEIPPAPVVSFTDPYLQPSEHNDGYVEVAQAVDPDGAVRVQEQLIAAEIPAEIQEDFVDGRSFFRVFASTTVDHDELGMMLQHIRFTGAEGSEDGTLVAEMPNFSALQTVEIKGPKWVSVGVYNSRNEALSIIQKMARRAIPGEICSASKGERDVFRVFAGPAIDGTQAITDEDLRAAHLIENRSFCMGVAAAEGAVPAIVNTTPVRAPQNDERSPTVPEISEGAVRIRVGEATGSLKLRIPNPYSAPVQIPVAGIMVSLPMNTSPELVEKIRKHMLEMNVGDQVHAP